MSVPRKFDVGGVLLSRPFKLRKFGHVGLNFDRMPEAIQRYVDDLGFRLTDRPDLLGTGHEVIFTSICTDHHSLVLAPNDLARIAGSFVPGLTLNQLSWEVGTLEEVVNAVSFLESAGVKFTQVGRDMPGSNWAVYCLDPDGHPCELFYGMEQVGWDRRSKPTTMYATDLRGRIPSLPQVSEEAELAGAVGRGVDLTAGYRAPFASEAGYEVGGVRLPRPFRVIGHGPVGIFVRNMAASLHFYGDLLGFKLTQTVNCKGHDCHFLRCGTEHHSLILAPLELRADLGLHAQSTLLLLGVRVGSYRQLRESIGFLGGRGWRFSEEFPAELHPGIRYAAHAFDAEGHCLQLYYDMECVGSSGRSYPTALAREVREPWPQVLDDASDSYDTQVFSGPLW